MFLVAGEDNCLLSGVTADMALSRRIAALGGCEDVSIGWEREWLGDGGVMVVRWFGAGAAWACGCWERLCVFVFISPGVIAIVVEVITNINGEII